MLTVGELREMLEDLDDDMEVRVAHQPSWPMELELGCELVSSGDVAYLAEADQVGYLAGEVKQGLGW